MRYWMDTEFIDDGKTIELISMGIVAEDGRELYMQSCHFSPQIVSGWLQEHVLPHLILCPHKRYRGESTVFGDHIDHGIRGQCVGKADCCWRTRLQMQQDILSFMDTRQYGTPELHGWCCGYDWVVFCQLFGTMMDLPASYPHYMHDIQALLDERHISDDKLPQAEGTTHNALDDARHIRQIWGQLP